MMQIPRRHTIIAAFCWAVTFAGTLPLRGSTLHSADHEVFVIGNLADASDHGLFGKQMASMLDTLEHDWTVVLNGDLLLPEKNFMDAIVEVESFLEPLFGLSRGKVVVLAGDRDWDQGSRKGVQEVQLLEDYLARSKYADLVEFALEQGCPGPAMIELSPTLHLLALNTQWWNQEFGRPTPESAVCDVAQEGVILEELEDLIDESAAVNVIVAGHHAFKSHGRYCGYFPLSEWLLPIPGISFFATAYKQNVGGRQHLANARLANFSKKLSALLAPYFSIVYAGGHDRTNEAFRIGENVVVNSGVPSGKGYVQKQKSHILASADPGFLSMYYSFTGAVQLRRYAEKGKSLERVEQGIAFQAPCFLPDVGIPVNRRLVPCTEYTPDQEGPIDHPDSIAIAANPNYMISPKKQKLLGAHYRKSWAQSVKVPVLDLDEYAGGLFPIEEGGGRQTKSLKFVANDGLEYVFRSVDKDPSKALSYDLRSTIISLVVRDQTTTQQPYGALVIPPLLDRIGILHAEPKLYVMPNSEILGPFQSSFGGMLGLMEDRPVDPRNGRSFAQAEDIKRTINLFRKMFESKKTRVETNEFVRARIFDMVVGDWGKHEDNWKWAGYEDSIGMVYRPIPRDRDHVFALYDGFLPRVIDREWAKPSGEHFDTHIKGLRSLMWQARHLDRFMAASADLNDWLREAGTIKKAFDDKVVKQAVQQLPPEIYAIDGKDIEHKLIQRLANLEEYVRRYYKMLARRSDVVGSNKDDAFHVERNDNGSVFVQVMTLDDGIEDRTTFSRTFYPNETQEIRLFGMEGADRFEISGNTKKSILLRVVPGPGVDDISDSSAVRTLRKETLIYSDPGSVDRIDAGPETRMMKRAAEEAYRYHREAFAYNTYFPLAFFKFSSDYGLALNAGVNFIKHAYGKPDFSSKHSLDLEVSTIGNMQFLYDGSWRHVLGKLDLIAGLHAQSRRRYRFFFGVGNETEIDRDLLLNDYYTAQFSSGQAYLGLEKTMFDRSYLNFALRYEQYGRQALRQTIFDEPQYHDLLGTNEQGILSFGAEFDLDLRNRKDLPERGARIYSDLRLAKPLEEETDSYLVGQLSLEYFLTAKPFTLGVRGGVDYSRGEIPYYHLPTLGQNANLRGFRRNRFAGDGTSWVNSELRLQLKDKTTSLIPYKFGLRGFLDMGKVYASGEQSSSVHMGYGAGIYFVPLRERFSLNVLAAFSKEDSGLIIFSLGSAF